MALRRKRLPVPAVHWDGRGRKRHLGLGADLQPQHEHVHDLRDLQRIGGVRVRHARRPVHRRSRRLVADGYDSGIFVDDDGRVYMLSSTGKIAELSADGKTVINPSVSTYAGWNEGPELFKRAPYYYVTWSSNGTEKGANGIVNSARSMSLAGPGNRIRPIRSSRT